MNSPTGAQPQRRAKSKAGQALISTRFSSDESSLLLGGLERRDLLWKVEAIVLTDGANFGEGDGIFPRIIPEDHPDFQAQTVEILLGKTAFLRSSIHPCAKIGREMDGDRCPRRGLLHRTDFAGLRLHSVNFRQSCKNYQTNALSFLAIITRIVRCVASLKKIQDSPITEQQENRPVRLKVSSPLREKIRKTSDQTHLPQEKIVTEAIRRGFEILGRAKS